MAAFDVVGSIIAFESGELDDAGVLKLFAELIRTGQAWSLQGTYGRSAATLIRGGYIDQDGSLTEAGQAIVDAAQQVA